MNGDLLTALLVALGGGMGAMMRYALDTLVTRSLARRSSGAKWGLYPWGITIVNLSGSFALGVLLGAGVAWPALAAGLLGGYTTFSTTSLDTIRLARERRDGAAALNAFGMLGAGALLAVCGIFLGAMLGRL